MNESIELLRLSTAGSVDDGKSTLIGRLLWETRAILADHLQDAERASDRRGDETLDLALLIDGLRAEREQKITIDVAYRYFSTPRRKFIIADTPGHIQYTRNMVTGASTAELALILIDARKGLVTQSRRHTFITTLLRIPHLVLVINKMDLVDYAEAVYEDVRRDCLDFLTRLNIQDVAFIPVSALLGDNVTTKSANMAWYDGPTLLHHLEHVNVGATRNLVDFRLPVQTVIRPDQDFRGYAGQVVSGRIRPGDEVLVLPSARPTRVRQIVTAEGDLNEAIAGDAVILTLADDLDISRGNMIVRQGNLPRKGQEIDAMLCWLHDTPLEPGGTYWLQHTTRLIKAFVTRLNYRIDVDTMHRMNGETLTQNDVGRVQITAAEPLFYDPYPINRATGSFILIDPFSHQTVAAGMIRDRSRHMDELAPTLTETATTRQRSENVFWEGSGVTLAQREVLAGHRAAVLWFTGLSGAGKTTLARKLEEVLFARRIQTTFLDGDRLRHGLNGDLSFSEADRRENIRRVAEVARLAFGHGQIVLCSFISPFTRERAFARSLVPPGRFFEIYVKVDLEVAKRRDPKGLYAQALRGEIKEFTGISSPYEVPERPEIVVETDLDNPDDIVAKIVAMLESSGILDPPGGG